MYYKLTDQDMQTYNGFQWEFDRWYRIDRDVAGKDELCTNAWFHCYADDLLAAFMNPIHVNIQNPRLFRCNVRGKKLDEDGTKVGVTCMKIPKDGELELPEVSTTQRVAFGILCAKEVCDDKEWNQWADDWLNGKDRSMAAARAAEATARAARATARAAKEAAWAAAEAAWAAVEATAMAARAAEDAAKAAEGKLDLIAIARKAMEYE